MNNRQVPGLMDKDEFEKKIKLLKSFIGSKWLQKEIKKKSVLTMLWNRPDFLSSIELYTIADAINSFSSNTEWLSNYNKAIHNHKDTDIISQSYELISASWFNNGKQVVELCGLGNPGFDFKIKIEDKIIRVSCKKLQASDRERKFYIDSQEIYEFLKIQLRNLGLNGIQVFLSLIKSDEGLSVEQLKQQIIICLDLYKDNRKSFGWKIGGWFLGFSEIPLVQEGIKYYEKNTSIIFICMSPYILNSR